MRSYLKENIKFSIYSSVLVTIVSTLLFIGGLIYISILQSFDLWWIFIILVSLQVICSSYYCYLVLIRLDIHSGFPSESLSKKILYTTLIQGLLLNLFAFLYGLYTYRKIHYNNRNFF